MGSEIVKQHYAQVATLAETVVNRLRQEMDKLGFDDSQRDLMDAERADYRLEKDPVEGGYNLIGEWRNDQGRKLGMLLFHADGSFFIEQDVVKPHPGKSAWFVEAVNAWGRDGNIKAEARLLRMPE